MISFSIDNTPAPFGSVWVHLKGEPRGATEPYSVFIPTECLVEVFDPHARKPAEQSWRDFISADINDQGTWFVQRYFETLMKLNGETGKHVQCVLATVDDVKQEPAGIVIKGLVEEWCPEKYGEVTGKRWFWLVGRKVAACWAWLCGVFDRK